MVFWFFGYPGIGKDFLARKLSKIASIPHIDADDFLTISDKGKLLRGTFTQNDRIRKLKRIITFIKKLQSKNSDLTVADSLPDHLSRQFLLDTFKPRIIFVYVHTPRKIHLRRLQTRENHFFTSELLDSWIEQHWEPINIPYVSVQNSERSERRLKKKLLTIYAEAA